VLKRAISIQQTVDSQKVHLALIAPGLADYCLLIAVC